MFIKGKKKQNGIFISSEKGVFKQEADMYLRISKYALQELRKWIER